MTTFVLGLIVGAVLGATAMYLFLERIVLQLDKGTP